MTTANLAITDNDTVIQYTSGGESAFLYDFPILSTDELKVSVDQVDSVLGVDYTVSGVGDEGGGTVTFLVATTIGESITIWQALPHERLTGFDTGAAVLMGEALNTEFARQVRQDQENRRDIRRAVRIAIDDPQGSQDMIIPTTTLRAGKALGFAADGSPTVLSLVSSEDDSLRADLASTVSGFGSDLIGNAINQTPAEVTAGVTPVNLDYDNGVLRYTNLLPDGVNDMTTAIDNAWLVAKATFAATLPLEIAGELTEFLFFQPGDYVYNGTGLTSSGGNVQIYGFKRTVRIRLPDTIYFLINTGAVSNTNVYGLNFYGGLGVIKYSFTGNNVTGHHEIIDNKFSDYIECAIGNNSEDMPYLHVERNYFRCREGEDAFGMAFGGFLDGAAILDNDMRKNKVHIKIGDRVGGNVYMLRNQFINTGAQDRLADIWLVPNTTDAGGTASGQGTIIGSNKFGNENSAVDDVRILIAVEAAGVDRLTKQPSLVWNTASFLQGVTIENNNIIGIGSMTAAFIHSYVRDVWGFKFRNNPMQGGDHTYLVEWAGDLDDSEHSSNWEIDLALGTNPHVRIMPISNKPMGMVHDPFVQSGGDVATLQDFPTIGDDVSFAELLSIQDPGVDGSVVNATRSGTTDSYGGGQAAEIDASTATGRWVSGVLTEPTAGRPAFVELDIEVASTNPVTQIELQIQHSVTGLYIVRRYIACPADWMRVRIPFTPQTNAGSANLYNLSARVRNFSEGVTDRFNIGRLCVYQSKQAMNYGHIRTFGTGEWDEQHLIMGNYHIFMNGNDLLISIGAPTSGSDGAAIATAT